MIVVRVKVEVGRGRWQYNTDSLRRIKRAGRGGGGNRFEWDTLKKLR